MSANESQIEDQQNREADHSNELARSRRRLFSWWYVWIPIIVAVTLWIGGWSFGNYGGPWGSKPGSTAPKISAPATVVLRL